MWWSCWRRRHIFTMIFNHSWGTNQGSNLCYIECVIFTINLQKQFIKCLEKTQGTGKRTPSLVHPTIYSPPGPLSPCVPQPLSCGLYSIFYFSSVCSPQTLSCGLDNRFYLSVPVHFYIHKISRRHGILMSNGIFDVQWNLSRLGFSTYRKTHITIPYTRLR